MASAIQIAPLSSAFLSLASCELGSCAFIKVDQREV
jgi:hypothetical protein